jgi:hypothetical protein
VLDSANCRAYIAALNEAAAEKKMQTMRATIVKRSLMVIAGLLVAVQLVPFGRDHTNPPVVKNPEWDSDTTRDLAKRACFDCHSNETSWPWYSNVAPMSWLVQRDVDQGRDILNFSMMQNRQRKASFASEEVEKGHMPPWFYLPLHPQAQLTAAEKKTLIDGLDNTFE